MILYAFQMHQLFPSEPRERLCSPWGLTPREAWAPAGVAGSRGGLGAVGDPAGPANGADPSECEGLELRPMPPALHTHIHAHLRAHMHTHALHTHATHVHTSMSLQKADTTHNYAYSTHTNDTRHISTHAWLHTCAHAHNTNHNMSTHTHTVHTHAHTLL